MKGQGPQDPDLAPAIEGVGTSITAFLGRALRGPVNRPVEIGGLAEFADRFGGLWEASPLGYAVRDFFRNDGRRALVVRLFTPGEATGARATLTAGGLRLAAADEGSWGNGLRVTVEHPDPAARATLEAAHELGVGPGDLFDLRVRDPSSGREEVHRHLTVVPSPRRVGSVLDRSSRLVRRRDPPPPPVRPAAGVYAGAAGGSDGAPLREDAYVEPVDRPAPTDPWAPYVGSRVRRQGIYALDEADLVNLLVLPPPAFGEDLPPAVWGAAARWAEEHRAMLLVDPPGAWKDAKTVVAGLPAFAEAIGARRNAVLHFPRIETADTPRPGERAVVAPSGAVAGVYARTDATRGVWEAPAGSAAELVDARPALTLSTAANDRLHRLGINCLRAFPGTGTLVWGARTLDGDDRLGSEWQYVAVRRLALFLEESLGRGTRWAVFEPNGEPLWSRLRAAGGAFMADLFRRGALRGATPPQAYFVRCDAQTTTQDDVERGVVDVEVGFAPVRPAEFVVLRIRQLAGRTPPD